MAKSLGTLGDLFPDKPLTCCVHGCTSMLSPAEAAATDGRPRGMCNRCFALYGDMADRDVPCTSSGCSGTWKWPRHQQIEARAQGSLQPPANLCEGCRTRRRELADRPVPCRVKGCKGAWIWPREEQWKAGDAEPPPRFCQDCFHRFQSLQDQSLPCRIKGCAHTWVWPRFQQLEYLAAGKSLEDPPRRLCRACAEKLTALHPVDVSCRVKGCKGQWSYSPFAQLEQLLAANPAEPPQGRMCQDCFKFFQEAPDKPVPCRHKGCPNSWSYNRVMQLHDRAAGRTQPPPRLCDPCSDKIRHTQPKPVPCAEKGCPGTWTYSPADQVRDTAAGKPVPAPRRCADCEKFLTEHPAVPVHCDKCDKEFHWTAAEQLLAKLGGSAAPSTCADCGGIRLGEIHAASVPHIERPDHLIIRIPGSGRWNEDPVIAQRPAHITKDTVKAAEQAQVRIVALGDDLTFSSENPAEAWPALLEQKLNEQLGSMVKTMVLNAGIPGCTSAQAITRLERDVIPFAPSLVIFSFVLADTWLETDPERTRWRPRVESEAAAESFGKLLRRLKALPDVHLLFWTGNPILPLDLDKANPDAGLVKWAEAQQAAFDKGLAHARHQCSEAGVPILDTQVLFGVNGQKSTRKWMSDWCRHNADGARNLATWMAELILHREE